MRPSGVNAAIMRVIWKLEQRKMRAIGIVRIRVAFITGCYCISILVFNGLIRIIIECFRKRKKIICYHPMESIN